jgi:hypothetical protein
VTNSWRTICQLEAECVGFRTGGASAHIRNWECRDLRHESYGVELLHTIGFVYTSKAKHVLATNQTFMGVGGWLHGVQSKYHVFSETYVPTLSVHRTLFLTPPVPILTHRYGYSLSTVRAALEVKQVFEQLAEAEKGGVTPEQKQKLEEQATEKVCVRNSMIDNCTLCWLLCFGGVQWR